MSDETRAAEASHVSRWTPLRLGLLLLVLVGACVLGLMLGRPWLESAWRGQSPVGEVTLTDAGGTPRPVLVFAEPPPPPAPNAPPVVGREVRFWLRSGLSWSSTPARVPAEPIKLTARPDGAEQSGRGQGFLQTSSRAGEVMFEIQGSHIATFRSKY